MAVRFGCDTDAAAEVARELARLGPSIASSAQMEVLATGAVAVDTALRQLAVLSSEVCESAAAAVVSASHRFRALVDEVQGIDGDLVGGVPTGE